MTPRRLWPVPAAVLPSVVAAGESVLPGDAAVARIVRRAIPPELGWFVDAVNGVGQAVRGRPG